MNATKWVWDGEKARVNLLKHGVAFAEGALVFRDPLHLSKLDPHPDGNRWQTVGRVGQFLVFVVHTLPVEWKHDGTAIGRIISARIVTSHERIAYEDGDF